MLKDRTLHAAAWLSLLGATLGVVQGAPTPASAAMPPAQERDRSAQTPGALADLEDALDCAKDLSKVFQGLAARISPTVVSLTSHIPTSNGRTRQIAQGSGVVVTTEGLVVTNNHVVSGGEIFYASFEDGREVEAAIVGTDPGSDLAVLQLENGEYDFARLAEGKPQVGEFVLLVGNPFGMGHTVTSGIVSALGRHDIGLDIMFEDFIQTNAEINPGNSGGPLIDLYGQVVGINTAINADDDRQRKGRGLSYSIPSPMVKRVVDDLIAFGYVRRGYLGVRSEEAYELTSSGRPRRPYKVTGVRIEEVLEGTSAAEVGLERGDLLLSLDGTKMDRRGALLRAVERILPGTQVEIVFERDGERIVREVALRQRPDDGERRNRRGRTPTPPGTQP